MAATGVSFASNQHGKSRVRLGRVWREGSVHHIVEWNVNVSLLSDSIPSYTVGDNSGVVATDTMKNTVYVMGKRCDSRISPEDFALLLAKHFVNTYPVVNGATVSITEKPWNRVQVGGRDHDHGFTLGQEQHTVLVEYKSPTNHYVQAGIQDLSLLKTTQSGFEGFIRDGYTVLPETKERIVASTVKSSWKYSRPPQNGYSETFATVKKILLDAFFGPPVGGVYSPAVQTTLYQMGKAVLEQIPEIESIYLNMPNLHFLPLNMPSIGVKFADDVYSPTSEPHGTIEATLTRDNSHSLIRSKY